MVLFKIADFQNGQLNQTTKTLSSVNKMKIDIFKCQFIKPSSINAWSNERKKIGYTKFQSQYWYHKIGSQWVQLVACFSDNIHRELKVKSTTHTHMECD